MSNLISLSTIVSELHRHVTVTLECRKEYEDEVLDLVFLEWRSFFFWMTIYIAEDICICLKVISVGDGSRTYFLADIFNTEDKPSMVYYELYPIVMACVLRGK